MLSSFRLVRSEIYFTLALFFSVWGVLALGMGDPEVAHVQPTIQAGWALVASILSYLFLDAVGYFDSFKPYPSRAAIVTLGIALIVPLFVSKQVYFLLTGHTIVRYRTLLLYLPGVAVASWSAQWFAGKVFEWRGSVRRIFLLLDPVFREKLMDEFKKRGLERFFEEVGVARDADLIVVSRASIREFAEHSDVLAAHLRGVPVRDVRVLLTEIRGRESVENLDIWSFLIGATPQRRIFRIWFYLKSWFEPVLAGIGLVILAPLVPLLALGVRLSGPGPVFYLQRRVGYRGKEFDLVKFRSMVPDAEKEGIAWAGQQEGKITPFGRFLRKTHLDEVPQLWNILRGEMSFVGPRPERPEYYEKLKADVPLFWIRTMVKPGVTGWAQVTAGYASTVEESRLKLEHDLYYMKRMSPRLDVVCLVKTLLIFLSGEND